MKGKTVMFVGDSLGRNQWQSLICMLSAAAPRTRTKLVTGDPLSVFRFLVSQNNFFHGNTWHFHSLQDLGYVLLQILTEEEIKRQNDSNMQSYLW